MTGDTAYMYGQFGPYTCRSLYTLLNVREEYLSKSKGLTTSGSLDAPDCVPAGYVRLDQFRVKEVVFVKVR